jgi:hypothetical protein
LYFEVKAEVPNKMIVGLDSYVAEVSVRGENEWQGVKLTVSDFKNFKLESKNSWSEFRQLRMGATETLRPPKLSELKARQVGSPWKGKSPEFRFLRWLL